MSNLQETITAAARRLEVELWGSADGFRELGTTVILNLELALGEPGYDEALLASRDILALEAGINAVDMGDAAAAELKGIIFGFLAAAAGR